MQISPAVFMARNLPSRRGESKRNRSGLRGSLAGDPRAAGQDGQFFLARKVWWHSLQVEPISLMLA